MPRFALLSSFSCRLSSGFKVGTSIFLSALFACNLLGLPLTEGVYAEASTTPSQSSLTAGASFQSQVESGPHLLNFAQLTALALEPKNAIKLQSQLQSILNTPFVYPSQTLLKMPELPLLNQSQDSESKTSTLRVADWNIERGFQSDHMIQLMTAPDSIKKPGNVKQADFDQARSEAAWLSKSRVIFMEEVDLGMPRTQYQNIAKKMGAALNMHAVFAPEFLELSPIYIRHEQLEAQRQERHLRKGAPLRNTHAVKHPSTKSTAMAKKPANPDLPAYQVTTKIDPKQYRGLHGTAILTNYPILSAEIIRLPNVYNWYSKERKKISNLERVKRKAADTVFLEDVLTEIRYGSRMAVVVDISVPELPEHKATLVAVHLENRVNPLGRKIQMDYLLAQLKDRHNPIVIGGDWNTTGTDASPTSIRKEVRHYASDPAFWARRAVNWLTPYGMLIGLTLDAGQLSKNLFDPTAVNIPVVSPNKERALFKDLREFQFQDGTVFDTRGDRTHAYEGNTGFLANSNQRQFKGFVPTFNFERPILKGLFGRYKLDWFMVKDYAKMNLDEEGEETDEPKKPSAKVQWKEQPYLFAPNNARTLAKIDALYSERLSDHLPITIDLFLQEPFISQKSAAEPPKKSEEVLSK